MLTIIYDPEHGSAIADGMIARWITDFVIPTSKLISSRGSIAVASELAIRAVRNAVLEGRISRGKVQFEFRSVTIVIDSDGAFSPYPVGFCDISLNLHQAALHARYG